MKSSLLKLISLLLLVCVLCSTFVSCDNLPFLNGEGDSADNGGGDDNKGEHINYADQLKLDMNSSTAKQEVTVKMYIDGDTTHFNVPDGFNDADLVKARYLAVNTPESTGKIEEWGKKASQFTKEKLMGASSIIIESNDSHWNFDGNGRYLVWVWYKPNGETEYRNLNVEIIEAGLAFGSSTSEGLYGSIAVKALAQAKAEGLYVFSNDKDPQFPYGAAESVTIRELRLNPQSYEGKKVSFEGVVTFNSDWTAYVEEYDPETDMYYGMQVFYGYNAQLIEVLAQGNRVRVVGTVSQFSGTYQVSGLTYIKLRPDAPDNTAVISTGNEVAYTLTDLDKFKSEVKVLVDDEERTYTYEYLSVSTSVEMKNLQITKIYTTTNPSASDVGAMTLTCKYNGKTIDVRTAVFRDKDGNLITKDYFEGKTIDVKGVVDYFDYNNTGDGSYQIKVYSLEDINIH